MRSWIFMLTYIMCFKEWLRLGLAAPLAIAIGGCALFEGESYVEVHSVAVEVGRDRPASVWVHIAVYTGEPGCGIKLLAPLQKRQGNIIYISVRAREPLGKICTMALVGSKVTVLLHERFTPGVYRVIVNSKGNSLEKEFEVTPLPPLFIIPNYPYSDDVKLAGVHRGRFPQDINKRVFSPISGIQNTRDLGTLTVCAVGFSC